MCISKKKLALLTGECPFWWNQSLITCSKKTQIFQNYKIDILQQRRFENNPGVKRI